MAHESTTQGQAMIRRTDGFSLWVVIGLSILYIATFPIHKAAILVAVPIVAAGWFFGLRGAWVASLIGFILDVLLIDKYEMPVTWGMLIHNTGQNIILLGYLFILLISIGVGGLRESVDKRAHIETSLKLSENRYQAIVENQTDLVCRMRPDGEMTYVNESYLRFFEKTLEEVIGTSIEERDINGQSEMIKSSMDLLSRDMPLMSMEEYLPLPNGEKRWVQWVNQAIIENGRVIEIQSVGRDITERKRAEDRLIRNESQLSEVQDIARIGSWEWDISTNLVQWSGILDEIFGITSVQPEPTTIEAILNFIHPQDRERVAQSLQQTLLSGDVSDIDFRIIRPDGVERYIHTRGRVISDADGMPVRILGSSQDITERKNAEAALVARSNELEALFSISAQLRTARTSEEILPLVLKEIQRVLATDASAILLLNQEGDQLFCAMADGLLLPNMGQKVDLENTISGQVVSERKPIVMEDLFDDVQRVPDMIGMGKLGSAVYVPMQSEAVVLGVLVTIRQKDSTPSTFPPADIRLLTAIGEMFGNALRRIRLHDEALERLERMQALHNIDLAITSSLDSRNILDILLAETVLQLKADAADVLLVNPATFRLEYSAGRGFRGKGIEKTSLGFGKGYAGRVAQEKKPLAVRDVIHDTAFRQKGIFAGEEFKSYFCAPLITKDQVIGVLEVFHRSIFNASDEWMDFLATLATQAAISIDNANLLETTQQVLNETNALYRINQGLVASVIPNQLMKEVIDLLQKNFGYHHVQIYITDPRSYDLLFGEGTGEIGSQLKQQGFLLPAGAGIAGHVAETGQPFITNDVEEVIFYKSNPLLPDIKSEMALPIRIDGRVMGILDIQHRSRDYLNDHHLQLMSAVTNQLAVALQKANLYAELQQSLSQEKAMRNQLVQSERLTVMGRLLASVSHELNNPLQAIQNALYLLKEEKGISEQGRQDLDIVLSESERMAAMIERLRATYRPSQIEDFQPVQINTIVENVYALISTHLRHNGISFEFHPDANLPAIPGLADQLRQVILNLSMNAVEAMTAGGQLNVTTQFLPQSNEALLTVSDSGPGIEASILPNVFDAFITNKVKGTGLGLTISYDIIRKHQGRIKAENKPEGGATFSIWLPANIERADENDEPYSDHR